MGDYTAFNAKYGGAPVMSTRSTFALELTTDFAQHAAVDREIASALDVRMANKLRYRQSAIREEVVAVYDALTPVLSGELVNSTEVTSGMTGSSLYIDIRQPAINHQQTAYYAPFVIQGHDAWGTWVEANPYPDRANEIILPFITSMIGYSMDDLTHEVIADMNVGV